MNANVSFADRSAAVHTRALTSASNATFWLVVLALLILGLSRVGFAQEADEESDFKRSSDIFEEIVVTAVARDDATQFDSSVTVTTLGADDIGNSVPRSTAEILRNIPGVRSEASAGDGNTNISMRGIPVASGGSKYVQLLEDGLPVLQFGDIIVGTADQFLRIDWTTERVQAIRGGSAATLASNSPGGVINVISKDGSNEGGQIGITTGLDYDHFRTNFAYGSPVGNGDWRFHVGGYYRTGEGPRELNFVHSSGFQLKANVTREFDNGYIRAYLKVLDDATPTYLPMPVQVTGSNSSPNWSSVVGFDALKSTPHSADLQQILSVGRSGQGRISSISDGNQAEEVAFGAEASFDLDNDWFFDAKFRTSGKSGRFMGPFTAAVSAVSTAAGAIDVSPDGLIGVDELRYVSGSNAGVALTDAEIAGLNGNGLLQRIHTFDNDLTSLDNFTGDFSITKSFDKVDITVGYYKATQDIDIQWYWQAFLADVSDNTRLLDAFAGGVALTEGGQISHGVPDWGYCCTRDTRLETDIDAFYANLAFDVGDNLTIDASVRADSGDASGFYLFGTETSLTGGSDVDGNGIIDPPEEDATIFEQRQANPASWDWSETSYSVGGNYVLNDDTAIFARYSEGYRANTDRLFDNPGVFLDGDTAAAGAVSNSVTQAEVGVKFKRDIFAIAATLFYNETDDVNSEPKPVGEGTGSEVRLRGYEATGLEVEGGVNWEVGSGNLDLRGYVVYTDAEIKSSNVDELIGNRPRRQAEWVYSFTPTYYIGNHSFGLNVIGTTDAPAQDSNELDMDAYAYFNAFATFAITEDLRISVSANNISDEFGITESEEGSITAGVTNYVRARPIVGRSVSLSVNFAF